MRGEFIRGDGLVIPNNITFNGVAALLQSAFANAPLTLHLGLVQAAPDSHLNLADVLEPQLGVNGYARQPLTKGIVDWPTIGSVDGEVFVESKVCVFTAVGGTFTKPIQRMMLCFSSNAVVGDVFALSAPLPTPMTIGTSTPLEERSFKYQFYGR